MKHRLFFALRFYPQLRKEDVTMNLTYRSHCHWHRMMKSLILAVAMAGVGTFLIPADGGAQGLPAHDSAQTSQHNTLSGQATTHDLAQTAQHNALQTAIGNLSTTADHSGLPQAWDKTLLANDTGDPCNSARFKCVMGGAAVRDNETGLVWERSLVVTTQTWASALGRCANLSSGGRKGWRLPSFAELSSLVDPSVVPTAPRLK